MDLEARLRAFAAVARRGSFSRAASELRITQPAVSKHVADLEAALGARLFVREPRGARLTEAGEFLASYVSRAEALLARASAGIASIASAEAGRLTIAASGTPGVYLLPKAIGPFSAARPGVELDVRLGTSEHAVALVRSHEAEVAVMGGVATGPDLEVEPIVEDEIVIVGPPSMDGTTSARDVERCTWISREEGSGTRMAMERAMDTLGLRPPRRLVLPDWEMIKGAVAAGAGVAAVSRFAVENELAGGRLGLIQLPGWHVVRPLSLVHSRDVPLTPLAEHFVATVRRVLGDRDDRLERARAALAYAERADGRASIRDVQSALAEGITLAGAESEEERTLNARLRSLLAFWQVKEGDFSAAHATLEAGLRDPGLPPAAHADLLSRTGWLAVREGRPEQAAPALEQALVVARTVSDDAVERRAMLDLALAYSGLGRNEEARALLDGAIERARTAGDTDELLRAHNNGASILEASGDPVLRAAGDALLEQGVALARELGDRHHVAWMQANAAVGLVRRGHLRDAEHRLDEALREFQSIDEQGGISVASNMLAWIKVLLGEPDEAEPMLAQGAEDRYRGSSEAPLAGLELRAVMRWRTDAAGGLGDLRRALGDGRRGGADVAARSWLTLARMAFRCGDDALVDEVATAMAEAELMTPEERLYPEWVTALRAPPAPSADALRTIATQLESLESVLDAADAYADAAVAAAAASDRSLARSLGSERDRLLAESGAVALLD